MSTGASKVAFLFPGQGSQHAGMGQDVASAHEEARRTFRTADDALGFSLSQLCFEGPEEALKLTENTQPAVLTVSSAFDAVLKNKAPRPDYVAGHSLGEYSALVAASGLALDDAVRLVRKRGQYMQAAVPVGTGAMAAVMGLEADEVREICVEASRTTVVEPANFNGAGQVVIAGHKEAVDRAIEAVKAKGKRAIPLAVSAPFHCSLMRPAAEALQADLAETPFRDLEIPLFTNVDAEPVTDGDAARDALARQVTAPVRWEEIIESMASKGVTQFVEVGPGKVLSGLVRKMVRDASVHSVNAADGVDRYLTEAELV